MNSWKESSKNSCGQKADGHFHHFPVRAATGSNDIIHCDVSGGDRNRSRFFCRSASGRRSARKCTVDVDWAAWGCAVCRKLVLSIPPSRSRFRRRRSLPCPCSCSQIKLSTASAVDGGSFVPLAELLQGRTAGQHCGHDCVFRVHHDPGDRRRRNRCLQSLQNLWLRQQ